MLHSVDQTLHQRELYPLKIRHYTPEKNSYFYLIIVKGVGQDFPSICNGDLFQYGMQNVKLSSNSPVHETVSISQELIGIWCLQTLKVLMLWATPCLQLYDVMYSAMTLLMPITLSNVHQCFSFVPWPISIQLKYSITYYCVYSITRWTLGNLSF